MVQRSTFFARRALLILMIVFFLVPFALRGARMALQNMKNDVRDWLPQDFPETTQLEWFRQYFLSEQFVVISWDGCTGSESDERYKLFLAKLEPELPPTADTGNGDAPDAELTASDVEQQTDQAAVPEPERLAIESPLRQLGRTAFVGDQLGLIPVEPDHCNWGGLGEKWLQGNDGSGMQWYYITPQGDLYRWTGSNSLLASLWRTARRQWAAVELTGELVHSFGPTEGPWYYEHPRRLRAQLFRTVTTGPDVLASMTGPRGVLADDPEEAQRRLTGTLFGPDGKQTCLVVTLSDAGRRDLHQVLGRGMLGKPRGRLYEIAEEVNLRPEQLRLGGPPVDNVAIDEEGTITLVRLVGFSIVLGLVLSWFCFRSVTATLMVFFVGGVSAVLSLSLVYWGGSSVDAIMMSMPSLVYVLGLSGAAHIINYYHSAVAEIGYVGAPERAIRHGWKPAVLCNITTAIGLASLTTSELIPIRKFGLFSALGVLATLLILFTYLPASLELFPQRAKSRRQTEGDDQPSLDDHLSRFWLALGGFCIRHHTLVALACVAVIAAVGWGAVHIRTSVNMLKMFHANAKIIQDYAWLESHIGRLVPMEIVVKVNAAAMFHTADLSAQRTEPDPDEQYRLTFLERLELVDRVQRVIEDEFGADGQNIVGHGLSAATFAPPLPASRGDVGTFAQRGATNRQLELHRPEFLASDYLRVEASTGDELWRISLRVAATKGVDYGAFVADLNQAVEPVLAAYGCREAVLRSIVNQRSGERPTGARVLLLGVPAGLAAAEASDGEADRPASADLAAPALGDREVSPVDGEKIFARTVSQLLHVSRLRVSAHVPETTPLPDNWQELVAAYDCVVLLRSGSYDVAALRGAARVLLDARTPRTLLASGQNVASNSDSSPAPVFRPSAVYTGIVPIVYKAQRTLLDSLIGSTFWSFITITPLMMLVARHVGAGLVAMLPNVLPVLVAFGAMGWMGIDVDVGSMMTASVALGVAVDDTIHYLNWFREELDKSGDRNAAILAAYRHCATPTLQAAIISGLGLSIFALSTFTPTQRFGFLMLSILWMGMIAELIFFPALLAGPLGAVFKPRGARRSRT